MAPAALAGNTVVTAATPYVRGGWKKGMAQLLGRGGPDRTKGTTTWVLTWTISSWIRCVSADAPGLVVDTS